jgi:hypothetical protein
MIKEKQIIGMARSRNYKDKQKVIKFLKINFSELHNRNNGWKILRKFVDDSNLEVKLNSIEAIYLNFVYIPFQEEAWDILLYLIQKPNNKIRINASIAIIKVLDIFPDVERPWNDLIEVLSGSIKIGNYYPLFILPECFECLEDKEKVLESLEPLSTNRDKIVRSFSNNLIGRIYISKSIKAKGDEFNEIYLKGITHLKKSLDEFDIPPHKFCYVIHDIFNSLIEGKLENPDEIKSNITELKKITEKSTEKQKIIGILNELNTILEETLDAQKNGEDISKFKHKIIPICTQLNMLIGTLNNEIIRFIAEKAQEKIHFEYKCTIRALEILDDLIQSPDKLISEPDLLIETIRLSCQLISEPTCNHYSSKLEEIEKETDVDGRRNKLLQFIKEIKPVLEHEKSLKEIIVSGQREIKDEIANVKNVLEDCYVSINKVGPRQEIVISTGVEVLGTGAQFLTTIPLKEIGYDEIHDDIMKIKNNMQWMEIPHKLQAKILDYWNNKG